MVVPIFLNGLKRFWPALFMGAAWLWIFWPIIIGAQVVGFRDSAYLYYPLFQWIDSQWAQGIVPLWNPYCNSGIPVVHDGSSSVFYPGKLVFFVSALPYPARYGTYIAMHVPIAAAGVYWFARTLRVSQIGATLAAFSFAFSGAVLFQSTNVVFLVSAAWLPFALCSVWLMFQRNQYRWAVGTGVFCALMILGGDPQMCYHVGLIMCTFAVWKFLRIRRRYFKGKKECKKLHRPYRVSLKLIALIVLTVVVTSGLAAIQILPSYVWAQQSIRTWKPGLDNPSTIYDAYAARRELNESEVWDGILGVPKRGTHQDHAYQFSQPPWTVSELVFPNVSGRPFPKHQRWIDGLAGAERMWTPSLYLGCFVLVLALIVLNPFSSHRKTAWLARLVLFFGIASFGWYGPIWLAQELLPNNTQLAKIGSPVGGLYWLMYVVLPKYASFRYPAKLFVIATLALAVLAGLGLDQLTRRRKVRAVWACSGIILLLGFAVFLLSERLSSACVSLSSDLFGPFDQEGAQNEIQWSVLVSATVIIICCAIGKFRPTFDSKKAAFLILLVCALDIIAANSWLVPLVNSSVFKEPNRWSERTDQDETLIVYRAGMGPPISWLVGSSEDRLSEIVRWQRESLQAKHHLGHRVQLVGSFYSVEPRQQPLRVNAIRLDDSFYLDVDNEQVVLLPNRPRQRAQVNAYGPSRVDFRWENSNQLVLHVEPLGSQRVDLDLIDYFLDLQQVRGWNIVAREVADTGELGPAFIPKRVRTAYRTDDLSFQLPANEKFVVAIRYEPAEFWVGAWCSGLSWLMLLSGGGILMWRRWRRDTSQKKQAP